MIYATATQKGGTGKTTTAAALLQAAAADGKKVLAVDLDPQGNLTFALDGNADHAGAFDLFNGATAGAITQATPQGINLLSASPNLQTITSAPGSARRLSDALKPIAGDYDIIIIDTPPTTGELQYNAMYAADGLIIPLTTDPYSVQSLYQTIDTARELMSYSDNLHSLAGIITRYEGNTNAAKYIRQTLENLFAENKIKYLGTIRKAIAIQEAAMFQKSLYDYAPKSKPAQDYIDAYKKLIN